MSQPTVIFLTHVVKRDGMTEPFNPDRILSALLRAGQASGEYGQEEASELALQVAMQRLQLPATPAPHVEQIQDLIENALFNAGYRKTLRAYVLQREARNSTRCDSMAATDVGSSINACLDRLAPQLPGHAIGDSSMGELFSNVSGKLVTDYWLDHVYPPDIVQAHRDAAIHLHNLDMLAGYCASWSTRPLLEEGLNGVPGIADSGPPKHMASAVGQLTRFLAAIQGEWAGSQAIRSFDTCMAAFIRKDNLAYADVRQHMQDLVYGLNTPTARQTPSAHINLTFDWTCPDALSDQEPCIAGERMPFTYGELQAEMDMINRAFIEVMMDGDASGRMFTGPVPTYNITEKFNWDSANADLLFEMTVRYGLPYFQNSVNPELRPSMFRSMCHRLQYEPRSARANGRSRHTPAGLTGSLGLVSINGARLGFVHCGDEAGLFAHLDELLGLASKSLEIKRKVIQRHIDNGLLPCTRRYLGSLRNHFSSLGLTGIDETIRNFTCGEHDITTRDGEAFGVRLRNHVRARLQEFQLRTGHLYHLEAALPEESVCRFAREDRRRFPAILQAGSVELPCYTNSPQPPLVFNDDPIKVLEREDGQPRRHIGGTVVHLCMGDTTPDPEACRALIKDALSRSRLPYLAITPGSPECAKHGCLSSSHMFGPAATIRATCNTCEHRATSPVRSPAAG